MGGSISAAVNNDEMIDYLIKSEYIRTPVVEKVFRSVDRAFYFLPEFKYTAYRDLAWKQGNLHLSAPCIYSEVLEHLKLKPGHSFLNIGSGTGYLSTLAGLFLGLYGTNHGIEVHSDVVEYAYEKLEQFKKTCNGVDVFEFCEPIFFVGNGLDLNHERRYDRIYCGAACPEVHQEHIKKLMKVGGILVLPCEDDLLTIIRTKEDSWEVSSVLPVSFTTLQFTDRQNSVVISTPDSEPLQLQELCRSNIRTLLRSLAEKEEPELTQIPKYYQEYTVHNQGVDADLPTVTFERLIRSLARNYQTLNRSTNDALRDSGNEDSDASTTSDNGAEEVNKSVSTEDLVEPTSSKRNLDDDSEAGTSNEYKCAKTDKESSVSGSSSSGCKTTNASSTRSSRLRKFQTATIGISPRRLARLTAIQKMVRKTDFNVNEWTPAVDEKEEDEESTSEGQPNKVRKREKLDSGISEESDDGKISGSNGSSFSDSISNEHMEMDSDDEQQNSPCMNEDSDAQSNEENFVNKSISWKYRISMENKIKTLPLPNVIKSYLNYNRKFCASC